MNLGLANCFVRLGARFEVTEIFWYLKVSNTLNNTKTNNQLNNFNSIVFSGNLHYSRQKANKLFYHRQISGIFSTTYCID